MKTAKVFQNGQSQAVRLPKEFRFEGSDVFIKKMGNGVVLIPIKNIKNAWKPLFDSLHKFSDDFMDSREQPEQQHREDIF